jgi:glycosyltransferase involved in cell wall biosynthesis
MNRYRRILIVSERFYPETFLVNDLVMGFVSKGFDVTVFTQQPSYPRGRLFPGYKNRIFSKDIWNGARIIRFKTILGYRDHLIFKLFNYLWFAVYGSILAFLLPWSFDKVFIFQTGPLTMAMPAIVYAKIHKKPITIWTQDVWPDSVYAYGFRRWTFLSILLETFVRFVYRSTDHILISCKAFTASLSRFTKKPLIYAPSWPLTKYKSNDLEYIDKIPLFVFAGNIGKVQNLENIVHGFAIAWRRNPNIGVLRLIGDGSAWNTIYQTIIQEGAPVQMPGQKNTSEMEDEYNRAKYLVLSLASKEIFERTLPAKFAMYLAVGKPILCAAKGVCASFVHDHKLGVVADPDSPEEIAHAFECLSAFNMNEYIQVSENDKKLLKSEFDRDMIIQRIYGVL